MDKTKAVAAHSRQPGSEMSNNTSVSGFDSLNGFLPWLAYPNDTWAEWFEAETEIIAGGVGGCCNATNSFKVPTRRSS